MHSLSMIYHHIVIRDRMSFAQGQIFSANWSVFRVDSTSQHWMVNGKEFFREVIWVNTNLVARHVEAP